MLKFNYQTLSVNLPVDDSREYDLSTVNHVLESALQENLRKNPGTLEGIYDKGLRYLQRCSTEYSRETVRKEMVEYIFINPSSPQEKDFKLPEFDKLNRNTALSRVLKHIAPPKYQENARREFLTWAGRRYDVVNSTAVFATFFKRMFENQVKNLGVFSEDAECEIQQKEILQALITWFKFDRTSYSRVFLKFLSNNFEFDQVKKLRVFSENVEYEIQQKLGVFSENVEYEIQQKKVLQALITWFKFDRTSYSRILLKSLSNNFECEVEYQGILEALEAWLKLDSTSNVRLILEFSSNNPKCQIEPQEILQVLNTWLKLDRTPYGRVIYLYHLTYLIAKVQSLLVIAAEDQTGIATWSKSENDYQYASDKARECLAETCLLSNQMNYLIRWMSRIRSDSEIPCDFNEPLGFDKSLLDLKQSLALPQPSSFINRTFASNEVFVNTILNNWCNTTHTNCDLGLQNLHNAHPGRLIHAVVRQQYEYHQQCVNFYKTRISEAWNIARLSQTARNDPIPKKILDVIDQLLMDWHKAFEHSRFMARLVSGSVLARPPDPARQLDLSTLTDEMQRYLQHANFLQTTQFVLLDFLDYHKLTSNASVPTCLKGSPDWHWATYLNLPFKTFSAQLAISNLWVDRTFLAYEITQSIKAAEARLDPICLEYAKSFDNCTDKFQVLLETIAQIRAESSAYLAIFKDSLEKMRLSYEVARQSSTASDQGLLAKLEERVNYFSLIDQHPLTLPSDAARSQHDLIKIEGLQAEAISMNQDNLDHYVTWFKEQAENETDRTFEFANAEIVFRINHSQFAHYYRENAIGIREVLWKIWELHENNKWPHMAGTAGLSFQLAHRLPGRPFNTRGKVEAFLNPQYETSSTRQLLREIAQLSNWPQLKLLHHKSSSEDEEIRKKARKKDYSPFNDLDRYGKEIRQLFNGISTGEYEQIFPSISRIKGEFSIRHIVTNIHNFCFIVNYFLEVLAQREFDIKQLLKLNKKISNQKSLSKKPPNAKLGLVDPENLNWDFKKHKEIVKTLGVFANELKFRIINLDKFLTLKFDSTPGLGPDEIFRLWHHTLKPDLIADCEAIPAEYPPVLKTTMEYLHEKSDRNSTSAIAGKDIGTIMIRLQSALGKTLQELTAKEKNVDKINAIKFEAIQQIQNYTLQRAAKEGLYPTSPNRLVFPITPSKAQGPTFTVT